MDGVLLCKFDEERGYIPVKVYPPPVRRRSNENAFKEIARNSIGFGTQVDFQAFSLSGINCLAKRFSIPLPEARGGAELYALVIFSSDSDNFEKELLDTAIKRLTADWEARAAIMKECYYSFKPKNVEESEDSKVAAPASTSSSGKPRKPILPEELFTEHEGFFAVGYTLTRNLLMVISFLALFWVFYSNYNLVSFGFMLSLGIFLFAIVSKKDKTLKIIQILILIFVLLLFFKLLFVLIGYPEYLAFLGTYPDFTRPDSALLSFVSGILICFGLDRGVGVDKVSFGIGIGGIIFLIVFFFTPLIGLISALFSGPG
ncbi:MAG: hypothetical protein LUQ65_06825 [Candidatus Helarchaeota archaeon]|nr:hypothetical protein [Candidatus Helarchaeota archaeon]